MWQIGLILSLLGLLLWQRLLVGKHLEEAEERQAYLFSQCEEERFQHKAKLTLANAHISSLERALADALESLELALTPSEEWLKDTRKRHGLSEIKDEAPEDDKVQEGST